MLYHEASLYLQEIANQCGLRSELYSFSKAEDVKSCREIFGDGVADDIIRYGYIGGLEIPWVAEEYSLYHFTEIREKQAGFRYDANTLVEDSEWDRSRYVIGDWIADPTCSDGQCRISFARHGSGLWQYLNIAESHGQYLQTLAKWLEYFVLEKQKMIYTDDFQVLPMVQMQIRQVVLDHLDEECANNFADYLLG